MNNRAWFYDLSAASQGRDCLIGEQEYVGTVEAMTLTKESVIVFVGGRIYIAKLD